MEFTKLPDRPQTTANENTYSRKPKQPHAYYINTYVRTHAHYIQSTIESESVTNEVQTENTAENCANLIAVKIG